MAGTPKLYDVHIENADTGMNRTVIVTATSYTQARSSAHVQLATHEFIRGIVCHDEESD